jgi:hypothetical protein
MSNYRMLIMFFILPGALWAIGSFTLQRVDRLEVNTEAKISVLSPMDIQERFTVTTTDEASIPCPVMTIIQRDALTPTSGDCVFNDDDDELNIYDGLAWVAAGGTGGGLNQWATSINYVTGDVVWLSDDNKIYRAISTFTSGGSFTRSNWVELSPSFSDLSNRMENPSFEDSITSATCSGCTASAETTITFDGSKSYKAAFSAATGTITSTVSDTRLGGVQVEASCFVKTSAAGVVFKAQTNGSDVSGLSVDVPSDDTWRLIGIPFIGGSTSSGFQIEATGSITDDIFIDSCSVGTQRRVSDFDSIQCASSDCADGFSARVVDGSPAPVLSENIDGWISGGACARSSTGIYECAYASGIFTAIPQCEAVPIGTGSLNATVTNNGTTSVFVYIRANSSDVLTNSAFSLSCNKQSPDYAKRVKAISLPLDNFTGLTNWIAYTPTTSALGTLSDVSCFYRRVASSADIKCRFATGTAAGTEAQVGLPGTLAISSNVSPLGLVGSAVIGTFSTTYFGAYMTATPGDTFLNVSRQSSTTSAFTTVNGTEIGSSTSFMFEASVPIEGWDQGRAIFELGGYAKASESGRWGKVFAKFGDVSYGSACTSSPCVVHDLDGAAGLTASATRTTTGIYTVTVGGFKATTPVYCTPMGADSGAIGNTRELWIDNARQTSSGGEESFSARSFTNSVAGGTIVSTDTFFGVACEGLY